MTGLTIAVAILFFIVGWNEFIANKNAKITNLHTEGLLDHQKHLSDLWMEIRKSAEIQLEFLNELERLQIRIGKMSAVDDINLKMITMLKTRLHEFERATKIYEGMIATRLDELSESLDTAHEKTLPRC